MYFFPADSARELLFWSTALGQTARPTFDGLTRTFLELCQLRLNGVLNEFTHALRGNVEMDHRPPSSFVEILGEHDAGTLLGIWFNALRCTPSPLSPSLGHAPWYTMMGVISQLGMSGLMWLDLELFNETGAS